MSDNKKKKGNTSKEKDPGRTLRERKKSLEESSRLTDSDDLFDMLDEKEKKRHREN